MNTSLMTTKSSSEQAKQIARLLEDASSKAKIENILETAGALFEKVQSRLIETGKFDEKIAEIIRQLLATNPYASEKVESSFTYPLEYKPKSIREQVETLLNIKPFANLNATWALTQAQKWYESLVGLPDWIESPLVYIKWKSFDSYHALLSEVFTQIKLADPNFVNNCEGQLSKKYIRQSARSIKAESLLDVHQPGDFFIVPSQAGLQHRGKSARCSREDFIEGEFGLGAVAEGCRKLTHPERYVRWEQLHTDSAGDEYSPGGDGRFVGAPCFDFNDGKAKFNTDGVEDANDHYGSSSGVLPQSILNIEN